MIQTLYITLLIFIKEGKEETFLTYEEKVLPILPKYNGQLLYRIRPDKTHFIHSQDEYPYEIHLVSFHSKEDFENYKQDKERISYAHLFQASVSNVLLLEGHKL